MFYDLEVLLETFEKKLNSFPINEDGKHMVEMETIIEYIQYLIDDDNFLD